MAAPAARRCGLAGGSDRRSLAAWTQEAPAAHRLRAMAAAVRRDGRRQEEQEQPRRRAASSTSSTSARRRGGLCLVRASADPAVARVDDGGAPSFITGEFRSDILRRLASASVAAAAATAAALHVAWHHGLGECQGY